MNKRILLTLSLFLGITVVAAAQTTAPATTTTSQSSAPSADALRAYAGTYTFAGGSPLSTYTITVKDGDLYGDAGMGEAYKLVKQDKADQFKSTSSYGSMITFQRDAATKAITGLTLAAQGQELAATKAK
ncbi:DUF3471 domain-containing protein [uncultured Fibrella sp.]|uniref:DUF3471 domain-containing protein n=1 Tax=uncultured Fibrella sp. TaxID=1284596 RepID=UPI0035CA5964